MKILLDTHVFLWWTSGNPQLPVPWRSTLTSAENQVFLSAASTWEIVIKQSLGRIKTPVALETWLSAYYQRFGLLSLPITHDHALALRNLPPIHRDPFDRILIAQAIHEGMTLASMDDAIQQYGVSLLH